MGTTSATSGQRSVFSEYLDCGETVTGTVEANGALWHLLNPDIFVGDRHGVLSLRDDTNDNVVLTLFSNDDPAASNSDGWAVHYGNYHYMRYSDNIGSDPLLTIQVEDVSGRGGRNNLTVL